MAAEQPRDPGSCLALRSDQPLVGVVVEEDGREVVRYFAGDVPEQDEPSDEAVADALGLAGAWSDLDWQQTADELDRIRHAHPPTPPIELDA